MRTTTAPELAVLASTSRYYVPRIKVANGSGTMIDMTSWAERITWDHDIDQPVSQCTIEFTRANGSTQSLSPLRTDSTLNVDDAAAFSALLASGRDVSVEVATVAIGTTPVAGDYKLMFSGEIEGVNFEVSPVSIVCRDDGGLLVDRWTGANWAAYQSYEIYGETPGIGTVSSSSPFSTATFSVSQAGKLADGYTITANNIVYTVSAFDGTTTCALTPLPVALLGGHAFIINAREMETVMQDILDDAVDAGPVPISVTLDVPVSPVFFVTTYKQRNQSVMSALQTLASMIGWDVRYRYDEGSSTFKLTLFEPDRAKTTPDYTFGPSQYFQVSRLNIDRTNIRNQIHVSFYNRALRGRDLFITGDGPSQDQYGFRYMRIEEPDDSPINTVTEASSLVDAVLADLKDPKAEQEVELDFFWPADLGDLYRYSPNAVHNNTNQDYAVVRIEHDLSAGSFRTRLKTRGQPAGANKNWLAPPVPHPAPFTPRLIGPLGNVLIDMEAGDLTKQMIISSAAFYPESDATDYTSTPDGLEVDTGSGTFMAFAPLPQGVTITKLEMWSKNPSGGGASDVTCRLYRQSATAFGSATQIAIATRTAVASDGGGMDASSTVSELVSTNTYCLELDLGDSLDLFLNAIIYYTMPSYDKAI